MAYQSLYRKYRPQTFTDVVGQEHVVRTLQNAIVAGRIAHGYLFTGTRGTAKTTIARLLAKALNCLSGKGPVAEPCNACDACKEITAGNCIDVIELDAASHRGVADIEEVRKQVGYGPMEFRYKVFIIDEAHQLSSDAKDAFLKTLEEPPPGVVFILATTEPQSIPITIRSRCQQFDFKRGSLGDISRRLKYVLDCEGVTYTSEAINLVARGAEGSYRDSLSLLEQVLAFSPKQISAASVESVLGTLDSEQLARVTDCVARRDAPGALALAGEILDSGKEARTLLKTLAGHFRDLLLVSVGGPAAASELAPEDVARLQGQVRYFAPPQLLKAIDLLNEAQGETRWNNQHRLLTELTFLKLMTIGEAPDQPFATAPIVFAQPVAASTPLPGPSPRPSGDPLPVKEEGQRSVDAIPTNPLPPRSGTQEEGRPEGGEMAPEPDPVLEAALEASYFADDTPTDDGGYEDDEELEPEPERQPEVVAEPEAIVVPEVAPVVPVVSVAPPSNPSSSGFSLFDDDEPEAAPSVSEPTLAPEPENDGMSLFELDEPAPAVAPKPTPALVAPPEPAPAPKAKPARSEDDLPPLPDDEFPPPLDDDYGMAPPTTPNPLPSEAAQEEGRAKRGEMAETPPAPKPAPEPEPQPELELTDDRITLPAVQRAWPAFLAQAEKISKKTSVMMSAAIPVAVEGRTVVLAFTARMNYDMMNAPKQQEFVRKLLAKVLAPDLGSVPVRFTLAQNVPPPPQRTVARQKVRLDPLAQIEALGKDELEATASAAPIWTPPVSVSAPRPARPERVAEQTNRGNWGAEPSPPPDLSEETARLDPEVAAVAAPGSYKAQALSETLVQEILSTFGGEVVEG